MKFTNYILGICLGVILTLGSCETTELDLTSNPNALSPEQADATFFLNSIQVDFAYWVNSMGDRGGELTRINNMNGRTYNNVYFPNTWDNLWSSAYRGMLEDIRLMNILAEEAGLSFHIGMGKVFQAYIMLTLVDYFGDVPYSEALQGAEGVLNPAADSGESVYDASIALLDSAIQDFNTSGPVPEGDFFYNGSRLKWIKAANSIKKKALLNKVIIPDTMPLVITLLIRPMIFSSHGAQVLLLLTLVIHFMVLITPLQEVESICQIGSCLKC